MSIDKVAVIGSGLMGYGIAQVAAMSGQEVTLIDISNEALASALLKIRESLNRLSAKGKIQESPQSVLKKIRTTTELSNGVSDADFVIEAVFEDINLKRKLLSEVDAHAPKHAILATNTSGLSVTVIAEATRKAEKVIGMHWMNPPQIMKGIEIIKSKYTAEETLQSTLDLCKRYGKDPILARKDVWFFLAARAQTGWQLEAGLMYLRKEADFKEIDAIGRYKIGLPMGPLELMDFTGTVDIRTRGLDSTENILKTFPEFEPWPAFLALYRYLVKELWAPLREKGLSGVKSGRGFYQYPGGKYVKPEISQELAGKVDPIQLLAPAMNTAAWCVSNGVGSLNDVNRSFRLAYGWPKGIFEFVDEYGPGNVASILKAKEEKAPEDLRNFYKVDPLLATWKS